MAFDRYVIRFSLRLGLIFLAMLALALLIGEQARLFSILSVTLILLFLILELFRTLLRTNRIVTSLLESIRFGDFNRNIRDKARDLGFESLADSAQEIIRAIASSRIQKEAQFQYLKVILEHIHTAVLTLEEENRPQMINPLALNCLGLYNTISPGWQDIEKAAPEFAGLVTRLGAAGRGMVRLSNKPTGKKLLVLVNTVKITGKPVRIVTFQDIEPEIEQKEMESWHTISRIMAHEIMNSLTPLSSLTETGIMLLEKDGKVRSHRDLTQDTIDNLYTALKTISDRNRALARFIGNYRQLSRLPEPEKKEIRISELIREIHRLYQSQCSRKGIMFSVVPGPDKHAIQADESQAKQVLINLVKNGIEAIESNKDPVLQITVKRILDTMAVEVSDNGPGIPSDIMEKIFVPFFSTKPEGSGIGLSLSRQIIHNHGGQISVKSEKGKGTTFMVTFPMEKS